MKATTLLKRDHAAVKKLFRAYEAAHRQNDDEEVAAIYGQIALELKVHTQIEQEIFYPAAQALEDEDSDGSVLEALEEHAVVKTLLMQLDQMTPSDESFHAKVTVMIEAVEHHAGEEEEDMFPRAEKGMAAPELNELGAELEARKEELVAYHAGKNDGVDAPEQSIHA